VSDRDRYNTMMEPRIEDLLERTHSKFGLVSLAARRARQINSYYGQLGDGLGTIVPPQVTSSASKSLSIAFEEIAADKIVGRSIAEMQAEAEAAAETASSESEPAESTPDAD
jgi:DNA-directed RNA polymerase subunit omega